MKCMKVPLTEAETIKKKLLGSKLIDNNYKPEKDKNYIYYPVINGILGYSTVEKQLERKTPKDLRSALKNILSKNEIIHLNTSFDTIGNIAVLEIDKELEKKGRLIAKELLKINKNIKTVVEKKGGHEGEYRIQKYMFLAGENNFETIHKENGIKVKLDISKVYFSPRISTERLRIAKQVKHNEKILVMFSGVGIYSFVISKNSKAKEITCIELNPDGANYCHENIVLNKTKNIISYCGDVSDIIPKLKKIKYDRILMPLPKDSLKFLDLASKVIKNQGIIHIYIFSEENEIEEKINYIKKILKCKLIKFIKVGQQNPKVWRYCIDIKVVNL